MNECLLFFVKYPEPGQVKTRLAAGSSPELAAEFYRVFAREKLAELAEGFQGDVIVYYAPESAGDRMADWLGDGYRYLAQKGTDLGRRMENAFREVFFMGYERAALTGSDVPGLTPEIVSEGVTVVGSNSVSLGPARDGGYYLIGFHRDGFAPAVFRGMEWGTSGVFSATTSMLNRMVVDCRVLATLSDIDTVDALRELLASGMETGLGERSLAVAGKLLGS